MQSNFALQRAVDWANGLGKPLLILEALRCDYEWASDRLHQFVIDGMRANQRRCGDRAGYYPYLEPNVGDGRGLLKELSDDAAVVVTDDFPCFFLPRMLNAAEKHVNVRFEAVDSNGVLPFNATDRTFHRAVDFRRYMQRCIAEHLSATPRVEPLNALERKEAIKPAKRITTRWPAADLASESLLENLPIDKAVPVAPATGGTDAAVEVLERFVSERLGDYTESRNRHKDATSELSPHLHFGHISSHDVFRAIVEVEDWDIEQLSDTRRGQREGFWNMSRPAEAFLDQIITWRELGYNFTSHQPDYQRYESLPDWARKTLEEHANDERPEQYSDEQLERAETGDPIWNAAQRQLVMEGRMHNYVRMLWGKKVLQWSESPRLALERLIHLNNKYALDGRNPNSYSGIFWCFGRFDRAWGPERPIFGKIRYMTSDSTKRKIDTKSYLRAYGAEQQTSLFG